MDLEADKFYLVYGSEDDDHPMTFGGPYDTIRDALRNLYAKAACWGAQYKNTAEDAKISMDHYGHVSHPSQNLRIVRVRPEIEEVV